MGARGLLARGVPTLPPWLLFVKGAIIVLSLIILALAAYAISLYGGYSYYYSSGVPGYLIFLAVKSWIVYGISLALELKAPQFCYRVIFLIAYVLSVIFWLSGWAWSASWAAFYSSYTSALYGDLGKLGGVMGGCAGLGAIVWILCIVNLVFFVLGCVRDDASAVGNVELGQGQKQNQVQTQTAYPQQPYAGQPVHPQQQQPVYSQPQQTYATQ